MRFIAVLLLAGLAYSQPPATIPFGSRLTSPIVNNNFSGLYTGRVGRWTGSGPPGDFPFSIIGDIYIDTASQGTAYACYQVHCTAVGGTNWVQVTGGNKNNIASTPSALRGDNAGNAVAVTGTSSNCVHVDGSSAACPGGGASIAATTSLIKGDGAGNGVAVAGTGSNCVHVDGTSAACPGGGASIPNVTSALKGDGAGNALAVTGTGTNCVHVDGTSATCPGGGNTLTTLTTCALGRTSASVLTIAASASDPCNIRVGNVVTAFTSNATLTISAGTGTVRVGFDSSVNPPTLKVYQGGLTFVCSGMACNSVSGSAFGADDIEIATATATSAAWDSNGVTDLRALPGKDRIVAGANLASVSSAGSLTLSVDKTSFFAATAVDPGCTVAGDLGKQWMDSTSATTTHFKVCANVASTPTWVQVF